MRSPASAVQHREQIPERKQSQAQNGAEEIQVVSGTVVLSPTHPRHKLKSLGDVSEHHHEQEYRADELQESAHRPLPGESEERDEKDRETGMPIAGNLAFISLLLLFT
jgi:hypothetical protein